MVRTPWNKMWSLEHITRYMQLPSIRIQTLTRTLPIIDWPLRWTREQSKALLLDLSTKSKEQECAKCLYMIMCIVMCSRDQNLFQGARIILSRDIEDYVNSCITKSCCVPSCHKMTIVIKPSKQNKNNKQLSVSLETLCILLNLY